MFDLREKRILVTGGGGFVGRHVLALLERRGCKRLFSPARRECDLTREEETRRFFAELKPEVVIHLAGVVGGIESSLERPGRTFYENVMMGAFCMEQARIAGCEKFVGVGTISSYPRDTPVPFREETLWDGCPEETHAPYGISKKMLLVQGQAYRRQFGFNAVHLLPVNLYGPGDHFDSEHPPVVSALVRRCFEAMETGRPLVCWGDGSATREFLYVEDCAEAIVLAAERYDGEEPVNVGSGREVSIKELVGALTKAAGFRGQVVWDTAKPSGQPRRSLDVRRAKERFGFQARTSLEKGLAATVAWYRSQKIQKGSGRPGTLTGRADA